jgi:hypothetical protein
MKRKPAFEDELAAARERNAARLTPSKTPAHMTELMAFRRSGSRPKRAKCEICGDVVSGRRLAVDHCHDTGKLRGFLCNTCNAGLGMFKDSMFIMGRAIKYLHKHSLLKDKIA